MYGVWRKDCSSKKGIFRFAHLLMYPNQELSCKPWFRILRVVYALQDMGLCRVYVKHRVPNAPADLLMAKNLDTGRYEKMSG